MLCYRLNSDKAGKATFGLAEAVDTEPQENTLTQRLAAKTGKAGATAFCEALSGPGMRFVPVKSANDQAALALPKTRDLLAKQYTATVNSLRGQLSEFGTAATKG